MKRLSPTRIPHALRRALSLCALSQNKSVLPVDQAAPYAILFHASQLPGPSAVLYRTLSPTLDTAVFPHSISIPPASAATTGGFLLTT